MSRRRRKYKKPIDPYSCIVCGERFETQNAVCQHSQDAHDCGERASVAEMLTEIGEDLPDGAFFAIATTFGIEPEDF